jgi:hypothetical protein
MTGPRMPRSLVESPPEEMIPKNLSEALVAIGKLQVTCQNQEQKLLEQDSDIGYLKNVISIASGWKQALFWLGAVTIGGTTIYCSLVNSFPWHKGPG